MTVLSCVLSEYVCRKVMKRDNTIGDLSAVVTGILLAFNLPVSINLFMAAFGSIVAIVVVKQMFGGIGQNFVNPALTARIVLMTSFPTAMNTWTAPLRLHRSFGRRCDHRDPSRRSPRHRRRYAAELS